MALQLTSDELLTTTRTVRKRLDFERPVPRQIIQDCLDLALQAPNGSNLQQWRWLVIDDPERIGRLATLYNEAIAAYSKQYIEKGFSKAPGVDPAFDRMNESVAHLAENLHRSPALVIPCMPGRMENAKIFDQASQWGSLLPAIWSFMLALRSRGLGSAWTTVHLHREKEAAELLGIPDTRWTQAGLFPVAYTLGNEFRRAPRKSTESVIRWNGW